MGVLAAKKANFDALTAPRKWAVRFLVGAFELGTPAKYETAGGDVWYVYSDLAIRPQFVEKFFWMLTKLVPNVTDTPARAGTDYQVAEGDDPLLLAASANGAPAWFTARSVVPESLSPVGDEGE